MKWFLFFLCAKFLILSFLMGSGYIGLAPDEAQYWTWSQDLNWGYYSKPPGIAWQIWLTSSIFGNHLFGIRIGAMLIGFFLPLILFKMAKAARLGQPVALWSAFAFAISPLGFYLSMVATTDGGAILGLTCAIFFTILGIESKKGPNYWLVGMAILGGALFKWVAFVFWPVIFLFLIFFKEMRKWSMIGGVALSLLALLPSLYWNAAHEWATFRHVTATVAAQQGGNFFDFLFSQIGLLSPIFFFFLISSFFFLPRVRLHKRALVFAAGFPALVLVYLVVALFKKIQPNWAAYLYPPAFLLIAWSAYDHFKNGQKGLMIGSLLSFSMLFILFSIPFLQTIGVPISYKLNPFRQSMGWHHLPHALSDAGYHPDQHFLFGDKYQTASLLSFYGPGQKRGYFFNLGGSRKNQFSYWPQMNSKEMGKTGYFVVLENRKKHELNWYVDNYLKTLAPYFETVQFKNAYPLFTVEGRGVKYALIFKCVHYLGEMPPETNVY